MKITISIEIERKKPAAPQQYPAMPPASTASLPSPTPTDVLKFPDYRRGYA